MQNTGINNQRSCFALFCIMDYLMKIVMTFTAMVMAKTSPDEHYSEHYWQYTIDIASG